MEKKYCPDPGCSRSLVTAATLEAAKLTVAERQMILEVLKRNEQIQKDQHYRIMKLKAELQILRRKGALKTSVDYDTPGPDPERSCGRCRSELGRVINRGAECRACRLKVCKNCRYYSTRSTDWVCAVCHKHMEIQAASGEWMNEFVRRPSRRRDNRVYVPAADLIKRTIRRSWTISNPSPRWTAVRGSPETRPYNSLPRDQDITNYPSLMAHQFNNRNVVRHSPARRAHSEDVYCEQPITPPTIITPTIVKSDQKEEEEEEKKEVRKQRINPLIKYASERRRDKNSDSDNSEGEDGFLKKTKRKLQHAKSETAAPSNLDSLEKYEKRVSFSKDKDKEEGEEVPIELCDIEPLSGTVFRKVTVRRRRQDMKKMQAIDAGWRRSADSDLFELFLPEGDDYKLVFLSSDSSSKEEDIDDNDSCSTASSYPIDDCDWDYFEPGGGKPILNWNSPFGSPRVYRRTRLESPLVDDGQRADSESLDGVARNSEGEEGPDFQLTCESRNPAHLEDTTLQCLHQMEQQRQQRHPCRNCGTPAFPATQYIPIPVPVPVPIPFSLWTQHQQVLSSPETMEALRAQMRVLPRALWSYLNQAALIWPLMLQGERLEAPAEHNRPDVKSAATATQTMKTDEECMNCDDVRADSEDSSDDEGVDRVGNVRMYTVTGSGEENDDSEAENRYKIDKQEGIYNCNDGSSTSSDEDDDDDEGFDTNVKKIEGTKKTKKKRNTSRVYVVNKYSTSSSGTDCSETSTDSSDNDTDVDFECEPITLTGVRSLRENEEGDNKQNYYFCDKNKKSDLDNENCEVQIKSHEDLQIRDEEIKKKEEINLQFKEDDSFSGDANIISLNEAKHENEEDLSSEDKNIEDLTKLEDIKIADNKLEIDQVAKNTSILDKNEVKGSTISKMEERLSFKVEIDCEHNEAFNINLSRLQKMMTSTEFDNKNDDIKIFKIEDNIDVNNENLDNFESNNDKSKSIVEMSTKCCEEIQNTEENQHEEMSICSKQNDIFSYNNEEIIVLSENNANVIEESSNSSFKLSNLREDTAFLSNEANLSKETKNFNYEITNLSEDNSILSDNANLSKKSKNFNYEINLSEDNLVLSEETNSNNEITNLSVEENLSTDFAILSQENANLSPEIAILGEENANLCEETANFNYQLTNFNPDTILGDQANLSAENAILIENITNVSAENAVLTENVSEETINLNLNTDIFQNTNSIEDAVILSAEVANLNDENLFLDEENNYSESITSENLNNEILSEDLILAYSNPNFGLESDFFAEDFSDDSPCLSAVSAESLNSTSDASERVEGDRVGAPRSDLRSLTSVDLQQTSARYTSLVMITQDAYAPVSVVTTDTTTLVDDVVVRHTNLKIDEDQVNKNNVTVITGENTQTVVCLEEGLADDDSWVENLSQDDDVDEEEDEINTSSGEEVTLHCTAAIDHEDELRGYHRSAIDYTLHTILEESCEESDVEVRNEPTDLEKYFFAIADNNDDYNSESSSIYSESMDDSMVNEETEEDYKNPHEDDEDYPPPSKLEQYFLSGFKNFNSDGSVGSDSEGRPSPEQRRKRLVRARGTGRSHSSSLDNLLSNPDLTSEVNENQSEDSDSDTCDESTFDKNDGQFDTLKHNKKKKVNNLSDDDGNKTPQPSDMQPFSSCDKNKQQSRDSGFVGSSDDLINEKPDTKLYNITEETQATQKVVAPSVVLTPPVTNLTRKDSFNNWSSDEETNLMMCKMHQFFKTMVVKQPVINLESPKPSPRLKHRHKSPQLIYFENELTRLMKTVPGIRDDQVREIVEYLSSEDTWSDSYDSSDYTSSDIDTTSSSAKKAVIQKQISESCKEIINKFEIGDHEGDEGDGGIESRGINKETAFVYQKLVASFEKMATEQKTTPTNSPPLIAKVMHHIGTRLVALMHEVSSGESQISNSPKVARHYHKKLQPKISSNSTTEEDENSDLDNLVDDGMMYNFLPRSKSHDPLLLENKTHQSSISDIAEEREVSDCERFSWRGSFESALLATDSRNKLSESPSVLAAKRRSAGDLLFTHKSLSREQLDRVRSCGSIGGNTSEEWARRRSSIASSDEELDSRSTLPRSLQSGAVTTNSLPRLPTNTPPSSMLKAQSMYHFIQQNVKSARYRPPGFNRVVNSVPKRAASAPGLQPTPQRRGRRAQTIVPNDDANLSEAHSSPMLASRTSKSATPSPVAHKSRRAIGAAPEWHNNEEDIDRLVAIHNTRSSFSNLGSRSDSMASVYSGAGEGRYGTVTVKGQIEFGLQYNYKANALEINVKQCKDLASVDLKRNRSDPYVKVYLLPDKSKGGKRKTKVKKHTLNPVFDEALRFHITLNGLETRTLWLTVWHSDMFGRNDFLGEVMMNLENTVFDDPTPKWYNLQERTEPFDDMLSFKGDILIGLKFVPPDMTAHKKGKRSRGALHVLVKEAKSLTAIKANGTSDPFCKSYLLPDKGRSGKQKTSVIRRTVNPVWNHTFIYDDVTLQELAERCLELTVWDHDRLASNEFLGGVRFSLGAGKHYGKPVDWMDATGKELILWKSMLERPNFWVEGCLSLRPTLDNQTT